MGQAHEVGLARLAGQAPRRLDDRIREYVARFEAEAAAVVAEEHYVQKVSNPPQSRRLRSDYVLVKPAEREPWIGYRDIFEVDGEPVRERDARLVEILSTTAPETQARAMAFVREGARFNLGPERTVNTPTMPLQLLARAHRGRFRLHPPAGWEKRVTAIVTFAEAGEEHTVVRTPEGDNVLSYGSVTVRVADGAILEARLRFRFIEGARRSREEAALWVEYADVKDIPVPMPRRMVEELPMPNGKASGEATYSNYRRFQTSGRIR